MDAAPTAPGLHPQPDPDRAAVAVADAPSRIGRLLGVVRKLVDFGINLANTLRQRAPAADRVELMIPFGTTDLKFILGRITCGLRRAAGLEARIDDRVARGLEVGCPPFRMPSPYKPRAGQRPARAEPIVHPRLAAMPTADQIAAEVRKRPIGAVIVDICNDLGITPGNAGPLWGELASVIIEYGGNLAGMLKSIFDRLNFPWEGQFGSTLPAGFAPCPPSPARGSTGPP